MVRNDELVREDLARDGSLFQGYHPSMEAVHRENTARLRAMIQKYGWPGVSMVGEDGEEAAWRIAQHSIGEPKFMRIVLDLLKLKSAQGDAPLWQVAFTEDRIRLFEGRLQLYGTSFDWDEQNQLSPYPAIEDPQFVNDRRAAMGLRSIEQEIDQKRATAERPPANLKEHRRQMEQWARSVGWRK